AVPAAQARLRPGQRIGAVCRDAGGRDGIDHLLHRRISHSARDIVVITDATDFAAARATCRRDDWIAWYLAHFLPKRKADGARAIVAGCRMIRTAVVGSSPGGCCGSDLLPVIRQQIDCAAAGDLELPRAEFRAH